jgi:hypothetical protein
LIFRIEIFPEISIGKDIAKTHFRSNGSDVAAALSRISVMKKIDIGLRRASDHFASHVLPANTRFQDIPSRENAISLAKALWETNGWLWSDRNPGVDRRADLGKAKTFDDDLFERCPDLQLVRDVAEAAKHGGELKRESVVVKEISGVGSPGGTQCVAQIFGPNGERRDGPFGGMMVPSTPECTLSIETESGSHDMKLVLATVLQFLLTETSKK